MGYVRGEIGLLEERELGGYLFQIYDADWAFLVIMLEDDEEIGREFATCWGADCKLTDDELLDLL